MHCLNEQNIAESPQATTLVDLLRIRASTMGGREAFSFLRDDDTDVASITYAELERRAMAIAGELQTLMPQGERALLLFPPGLDFIAALFGCLYAGVVAVPVALPPRNRPTSSVEGIVVACNPAVVLSTANHCELSKQYHACRPALLERPWIAVDQVPDERRHAWRQPSIDGRHTAFLQYTSGSTSSPKGVMLSHENLLYNAAGIQQAFGTTPQDQGVSWLPLYHDMGLIGGVVQPIYCGGHCALLAPVAFLQRPALWLETISRTQASVSGGPDFAYDLCVRKIPAKERDGLDLSGWKVAFTGAERIRAATIERFVEAFGPCGFRREAFFPCYGLAEATLMVSGGPRQTPPTIVRVHADALAHNQVQEAGLDGSASRTLVGCGRSLSGQPLAIVDPQTFQRCPDETVGEIWVQGSSVSSGYYRKPEATQAAFGAHLSTGEGPLLRTGDLGFLRQGQLFVTGRLKDLIIIRGRNYYPEDIEHALDGAHPIFRAGYCAAFSIEIEERERLVVVQEIEPRQRNPDTTDALRAIQRAIAAQHELEVYAIVLAKAGEIPKTSSGKTQRSACRQRYLDGQLKVIAHWESDLGTIKDEPRESPVARPRTLTAPEIEGWLIEWIAARLKIPPARVRISTPFLEFGLSSLDAVEMVAELERRLGRSLSPTAVYNYPNIAAVARWLASVPPAGERPVQTPQARVARGATDSDGPPIDVRTMTEEELNAFVLKAMAKQEAGSNYG